LIVPGYLPTINEELERGREELREVLRKFIPSIEPLKVRNEISTEKMTRDYHVPAHHKALRCLMKHAYVSTVLQAKSEQFYVLDTSRLEDLIQFMKTGTGLNEVVACTSDVRTTTAGLH
jgi:hypothetical protein